MKWSIKSLGFGALLAFMLAARPANAAMPPQQPLKAHFQTSDRCVACHNGMSTRGGDEFSIGVDWRSSLMANAAHDPYWRASVRRETMEHPQADAEIQDECAGCHMPIPRYEAKQSGALGTLYAHFQGATPDSKATADGVTCTICHQIAGTNFGRDSSFDGNFIVDGQPIDHPYPEYGPFDIYPGLQTIMRSSTAGFIPQRGDHIRSAELCATCHTLRTPARGDDGKIVGTLPEQMPYQEWLHSDYKSTRTCQSCHMPALPQAAPIARTLGVEREGAHRHVFVAANFFMQRMLGRYHDDLAVTAPPEDMASAADRTVAYMQAESAALTLAPARLRDNRLLLDVTVANLGGHKLPTAFPSRRVWLHVTVRDPQGQILFESGALKPDGSIQGNDNDEDPSRYEPHYREITRADQVQIYEAILADAKGKVTTGLLSALTYAKDNRLPPRGFDKNDVPDEIAVRGDAAADPRFSDHGHTLRYAMNVGRYDGPYDVSVELWYQPIGYRWASNLRPFKSVETAVFTNDYDSMATGSAVLLTRASQHVP